MKNTSAIILLGLSSIIFAGLANARPDREETLSPENRFLKMDSDQSESIDELELVSAFQHRADKQQQRIAQLVERDSAKAGKLQARIDTASADPMLGTPRTAAAFIIANFDSDGDWKLNREEIGQAFSSLRKWRNEADSKAS